MSSKIKLLVTGLAVAFLICVGVATSPVMAQDTMEKKWPNMSWQEILAEAKGQTVNWYMWGGSAKINSFISGWVATEAKKRYGITVNRVALEGTVEAVNKVLGEKEAGVNSGVNWIVTRNAPEF